MKALLAALTLVSLGCGKTVPAGGVPAPQPSAEGTSRPVPVGTELIPGDLDAVVRLNVAQIRDDLGEQVAAEILERATGGTDTEAWLRHRLKNAHAVWVGLRLADIDRGDHVVVVQRRPRAASKGDSPPDAPDAVSWTRARTPWKKVVRYDRRSPPARSAAARVYIIGDDEVVYASPVESLSVARVLRDGPDAGRRQPVAKGLLSLDLRPGKHAARQLVNLYPALGKLVGGLRELDGTLAVDSGDLLLKATVRCRTSAAARRTMQFLATIQGAAQEIDRVKPWLDQLDIRHDDLRIAITWRLPADAVASTMAGDPVKGE